MSDNDKVDKEVFAVHMDHIRVSLHSIINKMGGVELLALNIERQKVLLEEYNKTLEKLTATVETHVQVGIKHAERMTYLEDKQIASEKIQSESKTESAPNKSKLDFLTEMPKVFKFLTLMVGAIAAITTLLKFF